MSALCVRQAVFADLPALAGLFDQYRQFQGRPGDVDAALAFLRARFDHGESVVFIAIDGSAAIGFTQLYPAYSSVALARVFVLNDLFVQASGRRRGAATRLLAAAEAYAWSLGAARLTLNVAADNAAGQQLYAARGWQRDEQFVVFHRFARP